MSVTTIVSILLAVGFFLYTRGQKAAAARFVDDSSDSADSDEHTQSEDTSDGSAPYFTYETAESQFAQPRARHEIRTDSKQLEEERPLPKQFDLRQAVISQVILNNKYIGEIN